VLIHGLAVHAEGFGNTWDQKKQSDTGIPYDIVQRIEAIVAAAVGYEQRVVVRNLNEAGLVAPRRVVGDAIRTGALGSDDQERRSGEERPAVSVQAIELLAHRTFEGFAVERTQRLTVADQVIRLQLHRK
jgi:hypothetical protein